mgnify:CR=1 FL=1
MILIDPWLDGNPSMPEDRHDEAVAGATHILVTHGHFDHTGDVPRLSKKLGVPVFGIFDLMTWWTNSEGIEATGFNRGGTVDLNGAKVTMVAASHSSSSEGRHGQPVYTGAEAGYMIPGEGHVIYFSGDTDIFITPGYRFRAVDALWTNFHLPRSTLFMLVSAFSGLERMRAAYEHAIARGYRFYSYGDACLLERA